MIINIVAQHAGWFALVYGAARGFVWTSVLFVLAIVVLHVFFARRRGRELALVLLCGTIGTAWDTAMLQTGAFSYRHGMVWDRVAPVWIIALWLLFGTMLNISLHWLRGRPLLSALAGALGAPFAWYCGAQIGAVEFHPAPRALLLQGAGWAVITPVLTWTAARLDGYQWRERHAPNAPRPARKAPDV